MRPRTKTGFGQRPLSRIGRSRASSSATAELESRPTRIVGHGGLVGTIGCATGAADPEAGRRIFHNASIGQCANCHRHSGRGNVVGPDLSLVGKQGNRANLLRSILEPNKEVAPQYFATALELEDGNTFVGILLRSSSVDVYRDATGKERVFKKSDVVARKELQTSLMPTGLIDQMSDQDLQDVLAFLTSSGAQ